jgi:hypothetical protein
VGGQSGSLVLCLFNLLYLVVVRELFHFAGDLNSVETYLEFGPVVLFKVICCLND